MLHGRYLPSGPRAQVQIELHKAEVSRQPVGAIQAGVSWEKMRVKV